LPLQGEEKYRTEGFKEIALIYGRASKKAFYPSIFGTRDLGLMPFSQASISGPIDRILGVEWVVSG
jgi:hypothetical protein